MNQTGGMDKIVDDELMTVVDVLDALNGLSRRTFYRWRELGIAPKCIRLPTGELRIFRRDFQAWLEQHRERAA
jgi:predicted DNA-binding transcriptional regulator AlpA